MADITAYQRQDNYETRLTSPYSTGDASLTVNTLPSFALASGTYFLTIAPGTTDQVTVECSTVTNPITISGIVPNFEGGSNPSGITHPAGTKVIISNPWHSISEMKDAMNAKLNVDEDDTIAADTTWSITTKAGVKVNNLTTAQRTAITPTNGEVVYDTDLGQMFFGEGGAWVANASGTSVSNASTTVAGKVEEATDAEVGAGTAAGGTGARLFVNPGSVVKTSSGAGDENKLVALEADGKFADGFQNISEANATTLTNGSDADSLHVHDIITLGIDGSKLYYLGNIPFTEMETNDSGTPTLTHYGGFTNFATSATSF